MGSGVLVQLALEISSVSSLVVIKASFVQRGTRVASISRWRRPRYPRNNDRSWMVWRLTALWSCQEELSVSDGFDEMHDEVPVGVMHRSSRSCYPVE